MVYKGHYDIWIINRLQILLTTTQNLMHEPQQLTGWINGDLYTPANEKIGILPIPDLVRAAVGIDCHHPEDQKFQHAFLAQEQGTKYAVIAVHTNEEKAYFKQLMQENQLFNQSDSVPDWKHCAKVWNRHANGKDIFYKVGTLGFYILDIHNRLFFIISFLSIFKHTITSGSAISMRRIQSHKPLQRSKPFSTNTETWRGQPMFLQCQCSRFLYPFLNSLLAFPIPCLPLHWSIRASPSMSQMNLRRYQWTPQETQITGNIRSQLQ